jgi:hypothetical protein
VLTLLIAGSLLESGYLLLRDAVSTPRSYLTDSALGLGDAAPRAVPQDGLLAALSPVIDGGLIVKAILLAALWAAGYGAAVLARELLRVSLGPQLVATTVALWNPYVAERLLQGHWSLLAGYAALPWTALAAYRLRASTSSRRAGTWAALAGCLAAAGLTPTGALLAGCTALVLVGRRNILGTLILLLVASAPWLTATVLSGAGADPSDPAGIAAFAARAEPGLGTLGSLAGLGGIWNSDAVPDSRTTLLALAATILLLALVATGIRAVATTTRVIPAGTDTETAPADDTAASTIPSPINAVMSSTATDTIDRARLDIRRRLLILAVVAVVLPALGATASGMDVMEWLVARVPGAGLLRDTQKYMALAMPAYALCVAAGCGVVASRLSTRIDSTVDSVALQADSDLPDERARTAATPITAGQRNDGTHSATHRQRRGGATTALMSLTATVFIALLVLPQFDLAWGVGGAVRPVHYPVSWQRVAERIDGPGDVAVLPGGMFRKFPYSGRAPVLDPAPRMLPNDVLQTGRLSVDGHSIAGEGKRAREVESLLLQGGSAQKLADLGVGWVLVERTTPGPLGESKTALAQLDPVYNDPQLTLYRVPGATDHRNDAQPAHRLLTYAAHLVWAALLVGGLLIAALSPDNRRDSHSTPPPISQRRWTNGTRPTRPFDR